MDMPTYREIKQLAEQDYPGCKPGIAHLLSAWANHDPGNYFQGLLKNTGLITKELIVALVPLIEDPKPEDFKIVTFCLLDKQASEITGPDLLETICKNASYRIAKVLFDAGLIYKQLVYNLNELYLEPAGVLDHLAEINTDEVYLKRFTRNLNLMAIDGQFDDLIGREQEVESLIHVMLRRKKCNAILTGQPGIGKTVLVRLLAKRIVRGNVPNVLKNAIILELDIPAVVAGTKYRGQFEKRYKKILDLVTNMPEPLILFMDEIHMIMGAGKADGVNTDGANILKPYLTDKQFSVIGATTIDEYHGYIARDKAFSRRFEHFPIQEPGAELTRTIVAFQAKVLSDYHEVEISDEMIDSAIGLTTQHIPNRCQPDKTVDLLDISCAGIRVSENRTLTQQNLLSECARMTGRDIEFLSGDNMSRLQNIGEQINRRLIGQKQHVSRICDTLVYRRIGVGSCDRPLGVFMLSGKSGIGKTTFARLLAAHYYGNPDSLLFLDMAEYETSGSFTKLTGPPPGYIGYESNPGELTKWLRNHGSGVILFDEIEKANPDVAQSLLGLLDNGRIQSSSGEILDARQCIIIATTNAVTAKQLNQKQIGFQKKSLGQADIKSMLLSRFSSEFLNRFDDILLFNSLSPSDLKKIISLRLDEALERLAKKEIVLEFDRQKLLAFILEKLGSANTDARGISRVLEEELLLPLSRAIINSECSSHLKIIFVGDYSPASKIKSKHFQVHSIVCDKRRKLRC